MAVPFIEFRGVSKRFGDNRVLDSIDLEIYEGEVTTIIGLSGSGKSVLLKHIIGLLTPDEGEVFFQGMPLGKMSGNERDETLSRISYMFQQNALFDSMSVYENIALPLREKTNLKKKEIDKRVMARISQMELSEAAHRYPSELSGGMQKRAALARALVTDPKAVLFDEPTTGQDPVRKNAILSMIAQYQKKFGFTAILVSHEIPDVYFISNRILALYQRKIVFQGSPEEFEDFKHPFQDEVTDSLEDLQRELAGMYSKRQFLLQNHSLQRRLQLLGAYTILLYTFEAPKGMTKHGESEFPQGLKATVESRIVDYFDHLGGFSTRLSRNEFVTIMSSSRLDEVEEMFADFLKNLKKTTNAIIDEGNDDDVKNNAAFCLTVGLADGKTGMDMEMVIDSAKTKQVRTVRLYTDVRR
jgi:phospholipid/cholesterol/gamma-HCH transport system ATP-binding protein